MQQTDHFLFLFAIKNSMVTIATIRIIIITDTHTLFPMVFLFMSYPSMPHERVTVSSCFAMFAFVFTSSTFSLDRSSTSC